MQLQEHQKELSALIMLQEFYKNQNSESLRLLEQDSPYYPFLRPYVAEYIDEWADENYETNLKYKENLIYKSLQGKLFRSKSEVIIANALYVNKIPYRYECLLKLPEGAYFPDFTIKHPKTEKIYYWEHFGMMDNQEYCEKTFRKLKIYADNNIFPTINLITTYETRQVPLDSEKVQRIIDEYFQESPQISFLIPQK